MPSTLLLRIYDFLIKPLRERDVAEGNEFLWRYLIGPQSVWETIQEKIEAIKDLWSVTACPDEYLQYLKNIVGWTRELDHITENLDYASLRRLIAASVPLWKNRSTEDSIIDILNILIPARARIWNWFQLRWILDETIVQDERHEGRDAFLLAIGDQYWMNLRIVDNPVGTIDKTLAKNIANLMRPTGERFEIVYLRFLDLFEVDGDYAQWSEVAGAPLTTPPVVADGMLQLMNTSEQETLWADVEDSENFGDTGGVMVSTRIRTQTTAVFVGPGVLWYLDPVAMNGYYIQLCVNLNYAYIGYVTGGTPTAFGDVYLSTLGITLELDRWYLIRIECTEQGATNRIRVFLDGQEIQDVNDATYSQGTVALFHVINSDGEFDEIEVMPLPAETDSVEINF